ncbi:MAG: CapA family protein [Oscillospiraceae bacterium]|nr:CapA family protein [Oscillospiraceae bacterium]
MIDKDKFRRILKIARLVLILAVAAVLIGVTIFAAEFCYDFFVNGLFGDGDTSGFIGDVLNIPEPTQPEQTVPTEPGTIAVSSRATITVTGDVMMHMPVVNSGKESDGTYNFDSSFSRISHYVNQADYAIANLETTLGGTDNGRSYSGFPQFNSPDEIVDAAKNAGFDMYLTANNHTNDTGAAGIRRTYSTVISKGMAVLGTTEKPEDPGYQVLDINGIRVGMVCYTFGEYTSAGRPSVSGLPLDDSVAELVNIFDYNKLDTFYSRIESQIADMKEAGAEAIVLFIHWGNEYQLAANDYQKTIAQKMCDLGVDVIAGGHPHVIQPVTMLTSSTDPDHQTLCVYSLGNLLSNQRSDNVGVSSGHTEDGVLLSFTFVKYSNGEVHLDSADMLPTWVHMWKEDDHKEYCILPLDADIEDWKTALDITDSTYAAARASYDRTIAVIGEGLQAAQAALDQARSNREALFGITDEGVG